MSTFPQTWGDVKMQWDYNATLGKEITKNPAIRQKPTHTHTHTNKQTHQNIQQTTKKQRQINVFYLAISITTLRTTFIIFGSVYCVGLCSSRFRPGVWLRLFAASCCASWAFFSRGIILYHWYPLDTSKSLISPATMGTRTHLANGPWKKSLNFIFPTKYGIPKGSKG